MVETVRARPRLPAAGQWLAIVRDVDSPCQKGYSCGATLPLDPRRKSVAMCRFVIYLGPSIPIADLVTRPAHSLIRQSYKARERQEPLNGDGFGLAWYAPDISRHPATFRDVTPAWNNENLANLARVTQSGTILAHVRAATQGLSVIQTNCHPFTAGRFAFMHNGNVSGFWQRRRHFLNLFSDDAFTAVRGTTDSEHMFGLFLDNMARKVSKVDGEAVSQDVETSLADMAASLSETLSQVAELVAEEEQTSTLNLAVSDGDQVVVSRCVVGDEAHANTLYVHSGKRYVCDDNDESHFAEPDGDGEAIIIASEPLFARESWQAVPMNHLVLVDSDRSVSFVPWSP